MQSFRIIGHTADLRLHVTGDTLPELFEAALQGMNDVLKPGFCKQHRTQERKETISISSGDQTTLLIDFLSEVLMRSDFHNAIFCTVAFKRLDATTLTAIISGTRVQSFDEDIKAATYHEAEIKKNEHGKLETTIVFDI